VANALPTGEDQIGGLLAGTEKRECLFASRLASGSLLRASGQDERCGGKGARGELRRMEGLRKRGQEEGGGGGGPTSSSSSSSSSRGMREGGGEELDDVLARLVGPGLGDEAMDMSLSGDWLM